MVRALLANRKTQTRRIIKPQPSAEAKEAGVIHSGNAGSNGIWAWLDHQDLMEAGFTNDKEFRCPYGVPGDHLYVREAHSIRVEPGRFGPGIAWYRASCPEWENDDRIRWRPSIHMPRWASRITLVVTEVRVQRLHGISEADARAEGILHVPGHGDITPEELLADPGHSNYLNCRMGFREVWSDIHGPESWNMNPWVWAVSFEKLENKNG